MAHIWQQGKGRLRWVCVLPLQSMSEALEQLRFAHAHGAVGVFMRGIENEHLLHDPYFFTLYDAVSASTWPSRPRRQRQPLCSRVVGAAYSHGTFWAYRMSSVGAFHSLVMAGLPGPLPQTTHGFR